MAKTQRTCSFDGCERAFHARGLCNSHYKQTESGNEVSALRLQAHNGISLADSLALRTETGQHCWTWKGAADPDGYGHVNVGGVKLRAHRVAFELTYGPIGAGLVIDHICRNRQCVRPEHLQAVTVRENNQNLVGARASSRSGVRGVSWSSRAQNYYVRVHHNGRSHFGGSFVSLDEAERAAIALRNQLHTNNLLDRAA